LHLRIPLAGGDAQLGAGLHDPQTGDLQGQILFVSEIDQAIEDWIIERLPPRAVEYASRRKTRVACF